MHGWTAPVIWVIILVLAIWVGCSLLPERELTDTEIACALDPYYCEAPDYGYEPYRW